MTAGHATTVAVLAAVLLTCLTVLASAAWDAHQRGLERVRRARRRQGGRW